MAPLDTLSVSQVEQADHAQNGGCLRRWWFERVQGFRPEQTGAQTEGDRGHELLAEYLRTGTMPPPRVKMSKMVTAAINGGGLPAPGIGLIEVRFDGQEKRDAAGRWIPVDREKTFWFGGIPWDGFIDYQSREPQDGVLTVLDHKFTSDLQYAKKADQLVKTVQMPVYCMVAARRFPGQVRGFWLVHHYVCRRGIDSCVRRAFVTRDQVLGRQENILRVVERMKSVVSLGNQSDVPFNLKSCSAYIGCPHQARCRAFAGKDKVVAVPRELTPEEKALFGVSPDEGELYAVPSDPKKVESVPVKTEVVKRTSFIEDVDENENPIPPRKDFGPPPAVPEPPAVEKASCPACGVVLDEENSSRLRNGPLVHVGCPAGQAAAVAESMNKPPAAPAPAGEPVKRKPGRPPGSRNKAKDAAVDAKMYAEERENLERSESSAPIQVQASNAITAMARAQADETIQRIEAAERPPPAAVAQPSSEAAPDKGCKTTADGGCMGQGCMHDAPPEVARQRLTSDDVLRDRALSYLERGPADVRMPVSGTASLIPANISITVDVGPVLGALIRKLAGG